MGEVKYLSGVNHFSEKLWEIQRGLLKNLERDKNLIDNIYHYTSASAMEKIIKKDKIVLRFSRADCLNDIMEGRDIQEWYSKVLSQLRANKTISDDFYDLTSDIKPDEKTLFVQKDKNGHLVGHDEEKEIFLCCFSLDSDSLPMWRNYAKNDQCEGYNLKFRLPMHWNGENNIDDPSIEVRKVIYNPKVKQQILSEVILECNKIYQSVKNDLKGNLEDFRTVLRNILTELQYVFKKKAFEYEHEVRMWLIAPKEYDSRKYTSEIYQKLHFREKHGLMIPFYEIEFYSSCLDGIGIGPLLDTHKTKETLSTYLKYCGYPVKCEDGQQKNGGIEITSSEISLRYW